LDADTASELASKVNKPAYLIRNAARSGQYVNGFRIYRFYKMRSKV